MGDFQKNYLTQGQFREAELIFRKGTWYFNLALELPKQKAFIMHNTKQKILGIDLGENVIAATSWHQLQEMIAYKAEGAGIEIVYVNPAYSSQTCSSCRVLGSRHKNAFSCSCGSRSHADVNASKNISLLAWTIVGARGAVNHPDVAIYG